MKPYSKDLKSVEYLKVTKIAEWKKFKKGEVLIRESHMVTDLILIYNGTVDVKVKNKKVAN